jgi:hypothetical protein
MRPMPAVATRSPLVLVRSMVLVVAVTALVSWSTAGPALAVQGRVNEFALAPQSAPAGITSGLTGPSGSRSGGTTPSPVSSPASG